MPHPESDIYSKCGLTYRGKLLSLKFGHDNPVIMAGLTALCKAISYHNFILCTIDFLNRHRTLNQPCSFYIIKLTVFPAGALFANGLLPISSVNNNKNTYYLHTFVII